jgi:hypothetical protein
MPFSHSEINNFKELKIMRLLLVVGFFVLIGLKGFSQPIETIYPGTLVQSGYTNDESYGPFNIGFNFSFFGNGYTQFYLNTNGQILFDGASIDGENVAIPNASLPNNFIAGFWDDLAVSFTGKILYSTIGAAPNRKLIIQFVNMNFYNIPSSFGTYLVILYENTNKIQVQYRLILDYLSTRAHGGTATIGLENATGSDGKQHSYNNSSAITNEQAISFTPSGSTYTIESNAIYDGVYLTTNISLPDPGITILTSPAQDAIIGSAQTFEWNAASNAASYTLYISSRSDLADATVYYPGSNLSHSITGLTLDATYYWGVFATNATGTTWCEIKKFTTITVPPLAAIPQTIWTEQNQEKIIKLNYTGGDASAKTAIITSLPAQGHLYQYNEGVRGALISSAGTTLSDAGRNVIYLANGLTGNGAGNFNFNIHDGTADSPVVQVTVNVSPPGMPNLLYTGKATTYLEMQFDKIMANPAGKGNQFTVTVNGTPVTISSLTLKEGDSYTILATLGTSLTGTETVTIAYFAGDVASAQGGWLASFSEQVITLLAQTITFNALPPKQNTDPPFTLNATASSGLALTYSSSNLSVATISGNTVTLHSVGTTDITARQAGNGTFAPARFTRTQTVTESTLKTLCLTSVFLQGLYNGSSTMRQAYDELGLPHWPSGIADHITVELHNATTYSAIEYTAAEVSLSTNGTATITIPSTFTDFYYITIKHRNSLETTTSTPISFAGSIINRSFGTPGNIYGGNLVKMTDLNYAFYSGFVIKDDIIDSGDMIIVENDNAIARVGYLDDDCNGDGLIDSSDMLIIENSNNLAIGAITP